MLRVEDFIQSEFWKVQHHVRYWRKLREMVLDFQSRFRTFVKNATLFVTMEGQDFVEVFTAKHSN